MSIFLIHRPTFTTDSHHILDLEDMKVRSAIVGLGAVESSYVIRSCKGISDVQDPDLAPLKLYFQYLTQLEVKLVLDSR